MPQLTRWPTGSQHGLRGRQLDHSSETAAGEEEKPALEGEGDEHPGLRFQGPGTTQSSAATVQEPRQRSVPPTRPRPRLSRAALLPRAWAPPLPPCSALAGRRQRAITPQGVLTTSAFLSFCLSSSCGRPAASGSSQARDQIPAAGTTYAAAVATQDPFTHSVGPGIQPASWCCRDAAESTVPQRDLLLCPVSSDAKFRAPRTAHVDLPLVQVLTGVSYSRIRSLRTRTMCGEGGPSPQNRKQPR